MIDLAYIAAMMCDPWPCSEVGCRAQTDITWSEDGTRLLVQHGPNPEHVTLINPALSPGAARAHLVSWLRRVHAAERVIA